MSRVPAFLFTRITAVLLVLLPASASAQYIDFETLPSGDPTVDQQTISTEYAAYGVTFTLLDRVTGLPIGSPYIAKAGEPLTAFEGCFVVDTPRPQFDLGVSFLTDGTSLGVEGDLRIQYAVPVAQASGLILDIDCRTNGGPPCEQWTITAFDSLGSILDTVVLDGPPGDPNPECYQPGAGPGDAMAFGWQIATATPGIKSIILRYTGAATGVGLAFDNFSVAGPPPPPEAIASGPADTVCAGETITLSVVVSGGLPPYTYRWQERTGPWSWVDLGTGDTQDAQVLSTTHYCVIVNDLAANESPSNELEVVVGETDPLCTAGLMVSSHYNDRILRYSFRSRLPSIFVPTGSGGLDAPSKLICGGDGHLYVTDQVHHQVVRYDGLSGVFEDVFVAPGSGGLESPVGLDFGPDGNLYVASHITNEVLRYDGATGAYLDDFVPYGSGLNGPTGLVFGPDDDLFVCSLNSDKVLRFDGTTGAPLGDFVAARSGGLDGPRGLVFGPDGNLYIAEQYNDSVRRYDGATGAFIDVFVPVGTGGLNRANDVVFGLDGSLYVASFESNRVLRFDGITGTFLGELPPDYLNGPAWVTLGCAPIVVGVPGNGPPPPRLALEPGVPNPFGPRTTVGFTLALPGHARADVVDIAGRVVATLLDRALPAGRHRVEWDGRTAGGRDAPRGIYFICLESGGERRSAKVLLMH